MALDNVSINLPDIMKIDEGKREKGNIFVYNSVYFCQSILISNITFIMRKKTLLRACMDFYIASS